MRTSVTISDGNETQLMIIREDVDRPQKEHNKKSKVLAVKDKYNVTPEMTTAKQAKNTGKPK